MSIPDPDKIWPKLEEHGVDEVRKMLSMGVFADYKVPVIEGWLRRKAKETVDPDAPTYMYHEEQAPEGRVFRASEVPELERSGWVDTPAGFENPAEDTEDRCPVCQLPVGAPTTRKQDSSEVRCGNCGWFALTGTAEAMLPSRHSLDPKFGRLLAHQIRQLTEKNKLLTVTSSLIQDLDDGVQFPKASEQRDNLIRWLGDNLEHPGQTVQISFQNFQAIIGAADEQAFGWLVEALYRKGLLDGIPDEALNSPFKLINGTLSLDGWEAYRALSSSNQHRATRTDMEYDAFICHASEDKEEIAAPLAEALQGLGLNVWYDDFALTVGDSLWQSIDKGLSESRYGVVVLSPHFFEKDWTQKELDGLAAKEIGGKKVILPVWHKVDRDFVTQRSSMLAGRFATKSSLGIDKVVDDLVLAIV